MDKVSEIPKPRFDKARKVLSALSLTASLFTIPACTEPASDNLPPVLELEAGETISVVNGVIKPTEDINVRNTPSVINPEGSDMGNLVRTLNKGEEYEVKDAQIVKGYDVTLADKDDNGNLYLRVFNTEKQEYEYISMWAIQGMFEVKGESEILVSRLDDQGNVYIKNSNGQLIQIRGSLLPSTTQ